MNHSFYPAFRNELLKLAKGPPMLVTPSMGKIFGQAGQTLKPAAIAQGIVGKPPVGSGGLLAGVAPKARPAGVPTPKMVPGGPAAGPPRPAPGAPLRPVGQVQSPTRAAPPMAGSNLFGAANPNAALAAGAAPFGQAPGTRPGVLWLSFLMHLCVKSSLKKLVHALCRSTCVEMLLRRTRLLGRAGSSG